MGGVIITLENLFDNYKKFEKIAKKKNGENEIDLRDLELNPTTLLLFWFFEKNNHKIISCSEELDIFELPESKYNQQDLSFIDLIIEKLDSHYGGEFVLRHILSELTYNIHEHAFDNEKTDASLSFKIFDNEGILELAIMDNGISIPGRFDKANVDYIDDCNAVEKAINNFSTVSDNPYERGNGLWTTIRLVIEGNVGEILIISRKGLLHISRGGYKYELLDNEEYFKGTLISIRLNKFEVQNIYDLIELHKTNFYEYEVINDY